MKGTFGLTWFVAIAVVVVYQSVFAALPGGGIAVDPYRIESLADFNTFAGDPNYWDDYIKLEVDLDFVGTTYATALIAPDIILGAPFDGTTFSGSFDGNGHVIYNLTINTSGVNNSYIGLFGNLGESAEITNLGLENVNISTGNNCTYLGSLTGSNLNFCVISYCYATGSISGGDSAHSFGGLAGRNNHGSTYSNCYAAVEITVGTDSDSIGGLAGDNRGGSAIRCYATGNIIAGTSSRGLGGLVGSHNSSASLSQCYAAGSVSGAGNSNDIGGLVGSAGWLVDINDCYATGAVTGGSTSFRIGGLVGEILNTTTINNCYAIGLVSGGDSSYDLGGLIGYDNNDLTISSSYWNTETSGMSTSDGGTGKTTAEMMKQATYVDWDFNDIWSIYEDASFPFFQPDPEAPCQGGVYPVGDVNEDCIVDIADFALLSEHWLEDVRP